MIPVDPDGLVFTGLALVAAAVLSLLLTPLARRVAVRSAAIDHPGVERRVHKVATPRGGGLAVVTAFIVVGVAVVVINDATGIIRRIENQDPVELVALFGGAGAAAGLGFIDDRLELRARWQLFSQLTLALFPVAAGLTIGYIANPVGQGDIVFWEPFAVAFTMLWIVGMINSINFIDGLDGLSTGICLIAAVTLGLISVTGLDQPFVALLCAVFAGSLLGFLPWNFNPATIFIGTTGVYVLGYVLGVLSIVGTAKVAVALLVLGVPIIDTFWIIVRRLRAGRSPFSADRTHLHHRLLDLGLSHRGAVLTIYAVCAVLAVLSLVLSGSGPLYAFLGIVLAGGVLLQFMTRRSREALTAETYEEPVGTSS